MTADQTAYQYLNSLASHLKGQGVSITETPDGRDASKAAEKTVLSAIEAYVLRHPKFAGTHVKFVPAAEEETRHWYDFALLFSGSNGDYLAPTNIKISSFSAADNIGAKLGLLYALSGQEPPKLSMSWAEYHRFLNDLIGVSKGADYYFLVVEKVGERSGEIFPNSLRRLRKIVPNADNPPFQCKWSDNRVPIHRTFDEAVTFLLSVLHETHRKRSSALVSFEELLSARVTGHV